MTDEIERAQELMVQALCACREFLYADTEGLIIASYPAALPPGNGAAGDVWMIADEDRPAISQNVHLLRQVEHAFGRDCDGFAEWLPRWIDAWPYDEAGELPSGRA